MMPGLFRVTALPALLTFIICGNAAAHSLPGDAQMVAMLRVAGATTFEKVDKVCEKEDAKTLKRVADLRALFKPRTLSVDELCKGLCVKPDPDSDRPSRDEVTPDFMQEALEDTNTRGKRDLQPNSEQCEIWLTSLDALWQKYRTPLPDILFGRAPGAPEKLHKLSAVSSSTWQSNGISATSTVDEKELTVQVSATYSYEALMHEKPPLQTLPGLYQFSVTLSCASDACQSTLENAAFDHAVLSIGGKKIMAKPEEDKSCECSGSSRGFKLMFKQKGMIDSVPYQLVLSPITLGGSIYKPLNFKTEPQAVSLILTHPGLMELSAIRKKWRR